MSPRLQCVQCGSDQYIGRLHGDKGGPTVCAPCGTNIHVEIGRQRKAHESLLNGFGFGRSHAEPDELTLELLNDAISLTHPDKQPAERADMAQRVTAGLLALRPSVKPARKSPLLRILRRAGRQRINTRYQSPYIPARTVAAPCPGFIAIPAERYGTVSGGLSEKGRMPHGENAALICASIAERPANNAKKNSSPPEVMPAFARGPAGRRLIVSAQSRGCRPGLSKERVQRLRCEALPQRYSAPLTVSQCCQLSGASMPLKRMRSPLISIVSPSITEARPISGSNASAGAAREGLSLSREVSSQRASVAADLPDVGVPISLIGIVGDEVFCLQRFQDLRRLRIVQHPIHGHGKPSVCRQICR